MVKNKSGQLKSAMVVVFIFVAFIGIIMMGIFVYGANLVNQVFSSVDFEIGEQNFTKVYENNMGRAVDSFLNSADNYGLGLLFGMIIMMAFTSYTFREKQKAWIIIELGILFLAFIFAVTLQRSYNTVINSSTTLLDIYSIDLIRSSRFILNLPAIVTGVWAIVIVITYGVFRKEERGLTSDIGY